MTHLEVVTDLSNKMIELDTSRETTFLNLYLNDYCLYIEKSILTAYS